MKATQEKKYLREIVKRFARDKAPLTSRKWFDPVFWLLGALSYLAVFALSSKGILGPILLVVISTVLGMFIGLVSFLQQGDKVWLVLKQHIDIQSIESRIREIET